MRHAPIALHVLLLSCGGVIAADDNPGNFHPVDGGAGVDAGGPSSDATIDGTDANDDAAQQDDAGNAPPPDPTTAPSFLINPAHTGAVDSPTLRPPLARLWTVNLVDPNPSYPLIVNGVAYVLGGSPSQAIPTHLYAIDVKTGSIVWGPVDAGNGFAHTYDNGRLFTVTTKGVLNAFDASSGAPLWSATLPHPYPLFDAIPTAYRGIVYVGGFGSDVAYLYATDARNGSLLWQQPVDFGDMSSPTVTDDGVFVSYQCLQAYAFDRVTGAQLWHHSTQCSGGGGATTVAFQGLVYARDSALGNQKLDIHTGTDQGTFNALWAPAFDGNKGFLVSRGVTAIDTGSGATLWTFQGDGYIDSTAIVTAGTVYLGSETGMLYAIDEGTGQLLWSDNVGAALGNGEVTQGFVIGGFAAAEGVLITTAGSSIVAYGPATSADAGPDAGEDAGGD